MNRGLTLVMMRAILRKPGLFGAIAMTAVRLLLTRRWPAAVESYLQSRYDTTLNGCDAPMSTAALRLAVRDHDVLLSTVSDRLSADILNQPECRVRIICNYGVGFEHIDLEACKAHGIIVTNTPDVLTDATAELAVTLMLMAARRAGEGERELRAGQWKGWGPTHLLGSPLTGRTLGLVGFGRIAQAVAAKAVGGFGMKILYYARHRVDAALEQSTCATYCTDLDDLVRQSDFVSLHCPGGAATQNLIDARRLALMKPSAFLINTARGSVVDEEALAVALRDRTLAGAGLDVYRNEPTVPASLTSLSNVVLLPHLGSATTDARIAMGMCAVTNFEHWREGREPPNRIA